MNTLDPLTPEARETVERIRKVNMQFLKEEGHCGECGAYEANELSNALDTLFLVIDNLPAPKQCTEETLSVKEVGDLWEKMRYVGANNSYLFFHELNANGILRENSVRRFLGLIKPEDQCQ